MIGEHQCEGQCDHVLAGLAEALATPFIETQREGKIPEHLGVIVIVTDGELIGMATQIKSGALRKILHDARLAVAKYPRGTE